MRTIQFCTAVIMAASACGAAGSAWAGASSVGSSANNLSATFTSGATTTLGPIDALSGSFPPVYAKALALSTYSGSVTLPPLVPGFPTVAVLKASAVGLSDAVRGGTGVDDLHASGQTKLTAIHLSIVPSNPSPVTVPPFLSVNAQGVSGSASYVVVLPGGTPSATGTASLRKVTISGSLLGGKVVTFSGTPAPNTTLFANGSLTIIANEQDVALVVTCDPTCRAVPASITETPLAIHFNGAFIQNGNVTGEIAVGQSSAN